MWNFLGFPSPDDESTANDSVLWEENPCPFVLPPAWSNQWEIQQRRFLALSHQLYKQNVETNRRIMLACLETMKVPYV